MCPGLVLVRAVEFIDAYASVAEHAVFLVVLLLCGERDQPLVPNVARPYVQVMVVLSRLSSRERTAMASVGSFTTM